MSGNRWRYRDFLNIALRGFPRFGIGSIDVTYRCNLNCKHCYFKGQGHNKEQPLSFWADKLQNLQKQNFPFYICGWLGGEPLLRPEIIEYGRHYFKSNIIFTNGTLELPSWTDCTFVVSVHGTLPYYSAMTGTNEKVYRKVKRHAERPDLRVYVSFCVTRSNYHCMETFVREWKDSGVSGIAFEFYTPTGNPMDRELTLSWQMRDLILGRIKKLKQIYGDFIYNSSLTLKLMNSSMSKEITRNCPFLKIGFSYDPMGRSKEQCTLGPNARCELCGCILPFCSQILYKPVYLFQEFFNSFFAQFKLFIQGKPAFHVIK